ncbi:hypothetical protein T484DRAFT_2210833 [Baffinella frigidus]|nr:hypothetical protein T484DRAFT_2210833 [Cryptophyta sp. CCMP2293]
MSEVPLRPMPRALWVVLGGGGRFLMSEVPLYRGGLDVIRKEAWPLYRTSSGVRVCWELEEPRGPTGTPLGCRRGSTGFRRNLTRVQEKLSPEPHSSSGEALSGTSLEFRRRFDQMPAASRESAPGVLAVRHPCSWWGLRGWCLVFFGVFGVFVVCLWCVCGLLYGVVGVCGVCGVVSVWCG